MASPDRRDSPPGDALRRRDFLKKATGAAAGAGVLAACGEAGGASEASSGAAAVDGPQVTWRLATSFPPSLDILHGNAERFAERVAALTGGRFRIRVYASGEIVPALQVMDAVQQGTIQAGLTPSYYYVGKNQALAFDTAIPFGLTSRQQAAWLHHGGGLELMQEIYDDFGIVPFPAGNTGAQFGGWFRRPVETLADLRGLRFRVPGMGGEVMSRLGVSVQVLGGAEIYPALERGAIDATEWVGPYDDEKLGFHEIARYYYYPGWWEPGASVTIMVGRRAYDALPSSYQQLLAGVARETMFDGMARYDVVNPPALERLVNDRGVELRAFSQEIMEASWRESHAYMEELSARDATFRRVYTQWKDFRDRSFAYFSSCELEYQRFAFPRVMGDGRVASR